MRAFTSLSALAFLSFGLLANAHGVPSRIEVNGQSYPGAVGAGSSPDSPWRKVDSGSPVKGENGNDIICGLNAQSASGTVQVNGGDQLQIWWQPESGGNWFHNVGPIISYLAECPGDCSSFTPDASTNWFKIDEQGLVNGAWVQASLNSGAPVTLSLPSNIKPGQYLLRHEIIALHNAMSVGGAEFYPGCAQLTIGGSGSGTPSETVHFPGAYSATDPGIEVNVYSGLSNYVFPGGALASVGGSTGGSSSNGNTNSNGNGNSSAGNGASNTGSANVPAATGTGNTNNPATGNAAGAGEGKCASKKFKLKKRAANQTAYSSTPVGVGAKKRHAQKMQKKRLSSFLSSN